jgi:hypothetical protein
MNGNLLRNPARDKAVITVYLIVCNRISSHFAKTEIILAPSGKSVLNLHTPASV